MRFKAMLAGLLVSMALVVSDALAVPFALAAVVTLALFLFLGDAFALVFGRELPSLRRRSGIESKSHVGPQRLRVGFMVRVRAFMFALGWLQSFTRPSLGPRLGFLPPISGGANRRILEELQIAQGIVPVDLQTGANDGDWVSLETYNRILCVLHTAVGTAGDDPTITMEEAQDAAGAGAQALNFTRIYVKQATPDLFAVAQWTEVVQAAASTYTDLVSAELSKIWCVEIRASDLDVDDGYTHIRMRVADVGGNAQLGAILYIASEPRYPAAPADMRGIIA